MRVGTFNVKEIADIDYINDRIKPYFCLYTPMGWIKYPLGVFLISSPTRQSDGMVITRDIESYDKAIILKEDKFTKRYLVPKGALYTDKINDILNSAGIFKSDITKSYLQVATDIEFEIGTSKLEAVNKLLNSINYEYIHFDEMGVAQASDYVSPDYRTTEYEYRTDKRSIIKVGSKESLDVFNCPNIFVRYLSNPETGELRSEYINDNPSSKLSTVSRGRNIVDVESVSDIADQTTLDAYVKRIADERQIYETIEFRTALMPHHGYMDCLYVRNKELGIDSKYIETEWTMSLEVGGHMSHRGRRVVTI
jgi:hypothetical protein